MVWLTSPSALSWSTERARSAVRCSTVLEQAHVLDGDHGLVGEGAEQRDRPVRERPHFLAVDHDDADDLALAQHGHAEPGADAAEQDGLHPRGVPLAVGVVVEDVRDLHGPPLRGNAAQPGLRSVPPGLPEHRREVGIGDASRPRLKDLAIVGEDRAHVRVAQVDRAIEDGAEDRLEIVGRAADHAQDLGGRRLLLQRVREIARPLLDLALQTRVRLLELGGHLVELVGQRLELVAGANVDPVAQVAAADPAGARLQRLYGLDHAAGEDQAHDQREQDAEADQRHRAHDGRAHRLERLEQRLLDEHEPAQRRDGRVGRQHLAALQVLRDRHLLGPLVRPGRRRAGGGHLGQVSRSVFFSTRLMSGCAMSCPRESTT